MAWATAWAMVTRTLGAALLVLGGAAAAQSTAITHVSVIDVASGKVLANQTVVVTNRDITSVGPSSRARLPRGARIVDGRGRFLVPGLWDMGSFAFSGVNEVPGSMELLVAHGVTGIRNLRGDRTSDEIKQLIGTVAAGQAVGPKIIWSIKALSKALDEPVPAKSSVDVQTDADLVAAIDATAFAGAHFIFLGPRFPESQIPLAIATAARHKLPVSGWVVHGWKQAAEAGIDDLYHFVDLYRSTARKPDRDIYLRTARDADFRRKFAPDTNAMYAFMEPLRAKRDEAYYRDTIAAVARAGVPVTTNMATMFWAQQRNAGLIAERARYARPHKAAPPPPPTAIEDKSRIGLWEDLRDLHAAGVVLMTGTSSYGLAEALPGPTLHDELEFLVQAGFTPRQALQMATINPGMVVKRLYPRVRAATGIGAGQPADLVLLDANPLTDIGAIRRIHSVFADGRYFGPAEREALLAHAEKLARASE